MPAAEASCQLPCRHFSGARASVSDFLHGPGKWGSPGAAWVGVIASAFGWFQLRLPSAFRAKNARTVVPHAAAPMPHSEKGIYTSTQREKRTGGGVRAFQELRRVPRLQQHCYTWRWQAFPRCSTMAVGSLPVNAVTGHSSSHRVRSSHCTYAELTLAEPLSSSTGEAFLSVSQRAHALSSPFPHPQSHLAPLPESSQLQATPAPDMEPRR